MEKVKVFCSHSDMWDLEKLVPNPRNDNKHRQEHIELLSKVFTARGIRHPIIVSKKSGFIVAGHLRLLAAEFLELKDYPVDVQDFENEAEEYQFLTSDNNVARYAEFDDQKFIENLKDLDFDLFDLEIADFGLIDFDFMPDIDNKDSDNDDNSRGDETREFRIEVIFPNDSQMSECMDNLAEKGFIVKVL